MPRDPTSSTTCLGKIPLSPGPLPIANPCCACRSFAWSAEFAGTRFAVVQLRSRRQLPGGLVPPPVPPRKFRGRSGRTGTRKPCGQQPRLNSIGTAGSGNTGLVHGHSSGPGSPPRGSSGMFYPLRPLWHRGHMAALAAKNLRAPAARVEQARRLCRAPPALFACTGRAGFLGHSHIDPPFIGGVC